MIILLDLNFTLVTNSKEKHKPFTKQISLEQYDNELIDIINKHNAVVYLLTARPEIHKSQTIEAIRCKTKLEIQGCFFNSYRLPPPQAKERMIKEGFLPSVLENNGEVLAIESNPTTRTMYAKHGIKSMTSREFKATYK